MERCWRLEFKEERNLYAATNVAGKAAQTMGVVEDGILLLHPLEALFLMKQGRAVLGEGVIPLPSAYHVTLEISSLTTLVGIRSAQVAGLHYQIRA